jgi:uncharacterized membrane protein
MVRVTVFVTVLAILFANATIRLLLVLNITSSTTQRSAADLGDLDQNWFNVRYSLSNLSFSHPWPVLMIVVYDNWMTVGSAILDMRMISWEVVM